MSNKTKNDVISSIKTKKNITIIVNGNTTIFNYSKELWNEVSIILNQKNKSNILKDIEMLKDKFLTIANKLKGEFIINIKERTLVLNGTSEIVPKDLYKEIIKLNYKSTRLLAFANFWKKCLKNPSIESRNNLFGFIKFNGLSIDKNGNIIVQKSVNKHKEDGYYTDIHSETFKIELNKEVKIKRSEVDPNNEITCSYGLHVGDIKYVKTFGGNLSIILNCTVNPKDVVSIPIDYDNQKMRVCAYTPFSVLDSNKIEKLLCDNND